MRARPCRVANTVRARAGVLAPRGSQSRPAHRRQSQPALCDNRLVRVWRVAAMSTGALVVAVAIVTLVVVGSSFLAQRPGIENVVPSATRTVVRPAAVVHPKAAPVPAKPRPKVTRHVVPPAKPAPPVQQPILTTATLSPGESSPVVLAFQKRLVALGYWVGTIDGYYGDSTIQAVYALQKAAGITRDGVAGPDTEKALARGAVPKVRPYKGYVIEVNLSDDILTFVRNGKVLDILNTSTGGGYTYWDQGGAQIADTPVGVFHIYTAIDGMVTDSLGQLYRPRYFDSGFAIHGEGYVPAFPVSHGCVRVSDEAINWIWDQNMAPIGTTVWVYN